MAILWTAFIVFALSFAPAIADDGAAISCQSQVTIDDLYREVEESDLSQREKNVEITHLLNAAFTPYLVSVHDGIVKIPPIEIREMAKALRTKPQFFPNSPGFSRRALEAGFNRLFKGNVDYFSEEVIRFSVPVTEFNEEPMRKLSLALMILFELTTKRFPIEADRTIQESMNLICERTYAKRMLLSHIYNGVHSVAQSAGALTADPIEGWTAERMLKRVLYEKDGAPSLALMQSLMLPPAILGPFGSHFYFSNPLMVKNDDLTPSPEYRKFVKGLKEQFHNRPHEPNETGNGCPVGHMIEGLDFTGLQKFIDAVAYIYRAI